MQQHKESIINQVPALEAKVGGVTPSSRIPEGELEILPGFSQQQTVSFTGRFSVTFESGLTGNDP